MDEQGKASAAVRVEHERQRFREYLASLAASSEIALESTGHWYWIVDEMERAGHHPHLAEPLEAKKRMGKTHKKDALDAKGLAMLLRNGTLPEVWVPPAGIRAGAATHTHGSARYAYHAQASNPLGFGALRNLLFRRK